MFNHQESSTAVLEPMPAHPNPGPAAVPPPASVFDPSFTREEILAELQRVLGSSDFPASERNRRVLQYLVQNALDGRVGELGAYSIATVVYGRPANFDPVKDPIVRIEMARLRRDLETYYLKSGTRNPLRLSIPKGRYLPKVTKAAQTNPAAENQVAAPSRFLLSVMRAALGALNGHREQAAAAWQDLVVSHPATIGNLQQAIEQEVGDAQLASLLADAVVRAAGPGK